MIISIFCVALFIISIVVYWIGSLAYKHWDQKYDEYTDIRLYSEDRSVREAYKLKTEEVLVHRRFWSKWCFPSMVLLIFGIAAIIICSFAFLGNYANMNNEKVKYEETYAALVDADAGTTPHDCYFSQMRAEYNADVRNHQRWNKNPWINWFIPEFYDDLPLFSPN